MFDIEQSLKIIDTTTTNINGKEAFHNSSPIYKSTNEQLDKYKELLKYKKDILTVIASGDQILSMLETKPKKIDCFDISKYPKYFLMLKLAAVCTLTQEEFIELFFDVPLTTKDEYYDDLYFEKIRLELEGKYRKYWDALFNHADWYEIYSSLLFSSEYISRNIAIQRADYLEEKQYINLKDIIRNTTFNFTEGDITTTYSKYKGPYDLVYLSNIISYVNRYKYHEMLEQISLTDNGQILTYLLSTPDTLLNIFSGNNYSYKKIDEKNDISLMIYKRK